ncbi:Hypothetical predicted protein, partial [Paramuricea clavata]
LLYGKVSDIPSTSFAPSIPSTSFAPSIPSTSFAPNIPSTSFAPIFLYVIRPEYSSTSFVPNIPSTSFTPNIPSTSFAPNVPFTSFISNIPSTPFVSNISGTVFPAKTQASRFTPNVRAPIFTPNIPATNAASKRSVTFVNEHRQSLPTYSPPSFSQTDSASPTITSSYPGLRHTNPGPRLSPRVTSTPWDQTIPTQARISNEPSVVYQPSFESRIPVPLPTTANRAQPEAWEQASQVSIPRTNEDQFGVLIEKQCNLTEMIMQQNQRSLIPRLALSKFSGDPTEYNIFIQGFNSQFHNKLNSNSDRLRYLDQYLEGEAKELVKGCHYMDPDIGYAEARRLIDEKYGDPYNISNAFIKKMTEWPMLKPGDDDGLNRFSTFLTQCCSAMKSLSYLTILDHPHNLQTLVKKLPFHLQDRWRRVASKARVGHRNMPSFDSFANFIKDEAKVATDPIFSREALRVQSSDGVNNKRKPPNYKVRTNASKVESCIHCKKEHDLDDCDEYLKKSIGERRKFLAEKQLCYSCYMPGHRSRGCSQKRTCKTCSRRHPTGLHVENFQPIVKKPANDNVAKNVESAFTTITANSIARKVREEGPVGSMPIVPIIVRSAETELITYAMLDNCSTGTFILEDLRQELNVDGVDSQISITTMNGSQLHNVKVIRDLTVSDLDGNNSISLPKAFTKLEMPATSQDIPRPEQARKWPHLARVADYVHPLIPNVKIGLLIGTNCPEAIEPKDFVTSMNGGPYAVQTFAGWTIIGPLHMSSNGPATVNCNRIVAKEISSEVPMDHHFAVDQVVKEILTPEAFNRMMELDFSERKVSNEHGLSQEDKLFLKKVEQGTKKIEGHYEIPLPFREDEVLDVSPDDRFYWTDSTTVLKYLTNDKARYKTFVANRVQTIRDTTATHEWHYVDSALNPADDASRGLKMSRFLENKRWINGPSFLWKATDEWPKRPVDVSVNTLDDPEVAVISANTIVSGQHNEILEYFSRFSQWYRLKKAIAWLLRMKPRRDRNRRNLGDSSTQDMTPKPIMVEELEKAEVTILKIIQAESFPDEVSALKRVDNRSLTKQKTTKLRKSSSFDPTDLQSPISPSNILTMKSKIVMPPPGDFQRADLYLRKRWKRVQYLVEIFWTRWKREYLNTLQMRKKWNRPQRSFEIGDIVLVVDEKTSRNLWPLARVIDITPDSVGAVRSVKVKTATSTLERPIVKLVTGKLVRLGKSPSRSHYRRNELTLYVTRNINSVVFINSQDFICVHMFKSVIEPS